ncbi:uncharacterized protein troap isoform X2 [Lepisosteus oculatus]|uniref:uncharacterized protein troap isoform X2 n=1 Tax=Lepisosteus oculatus TaxID=7918 RepID=UPI0035F51672
MASCLALREQNRPAGAQEREPGLSYPAQGKRGASKPGAAQAGDRRRGVDAENCDPSSACPHPGGGVPLTGIPPGGKSGVLPVSLGPQKPRLPIDFKEAHRRWEERLQKGKAKKKPCTKPEPFNFSQPAAPRAALLSKKFSHAAGAETDRAEQLPSSQAVEAVQSVSDGAQPAVPVINRAAQPPRPDQCARPAASKPARPLGPLSRDAGQPELREGSTDAHPRPRNTVLCVNPAVGVTEQPAHPTGTHPGPPVPRRPVGAPHTEHSWRVFARDPTQPSPSKTRDSKSPPVSGPVLCGPSESRKVGWLPHHAAFPLAKQTVQFADPPSGRPGQCLTPVFSPGLQSARRALCHSARGAVLPHYTDTTLGSTGHSAVPAPHASYSQVPGTGQSVTGNAVQCEHSTPGNSVPGVPPLTGSTVQLENGNLVQCEHLKPGNSVPGVPPVTGNSVQGEHSEPGNSVPGVPPVTGNSVQGEHSEPGNSVPGIPPVTGNFVQGEHSEPGNSVQPVNENSGSDPEPITQNTADTALTGGPVPFTPDPAALRRILASEAEHCPASLRGSSVCMPRKMLLSKGRSAVVSDGAGSVPFSPDPEALRSILRNEGLRARAPLGEQSRASVRGSSICMPRRIPKAKAQKAGATGPGDEQAVTAQLSMPRRVPNTRPSSMRKLGQSVFRTPVFRTTPRVEGYSKDPGLYKEQDSVVQELRFEEQEQRAADGSGTGSRPDARSEIAAPSPVLEREDQGPREEETGRRQLPERDGAGVPQPFLQAPHRASVIVFSQGPRVHREDAVQESVLAPRAGPGSGREGRVQTWQPGLLLSGGHPDVEQSVPETAACPQGKLPPTAPALAGSTPAPPTGTRLRRPRPLVPSLQEALLDEECAFYTSCGPAPPRPAPIRRCANPLARTFDFEDSLFEPISSPSSAEEQSFM